MKKLIPVLLALFGLTAGMAAGFALRPAPEAPETAVAPEAAEGAEHAASEPAASEHAPAGEYTSVAMSRPFVVPVFRDQAIAAMVVVSLAIEVEPESAEKITANEPKLRDGFLGIMFRHANSGGFDGSFTSGRKLDDLKAALTSALHATLPDAPTGAVLITEIARQDS